MLHRSVYLISWIVVLYGGSLFSQFVPTDEATMLAVWGLLAAGAVVMSSACINWANRSLEWLHVCLLGALALLYLLSIVAFYTQYDVPRFVLWHIGLSAVYGVVYRMVHLRYFVGAFVVSLLLTAIYAFPLLVPFHALLFGLFHAAVLLVYLLLFAPSSEVKSVRPVVEEPTRTDSLLPLVVTPLKSATPDVSA